MPTSPTRSSLEKESKLGQLLLTTYTAEASRTVAFSVMEAHLPEKLAITEENAGRVMDEAMKSSVGSGNGKLIYRKDIHSAGLPAQEWRFQGFKTAIVTVRVFLEEKKSYQAIAVMPKGGLCELHVRKFLESFKLKERVPPRRDRLALRIPPGVESQN